ncbi:ribokinase [Proteinivorax hydrogeniformans]|uniref:Ribokinase n=1 Tax=Proteinivorax hydrogeniformans TaxID=1826727 RepID=A0AAU8HSV6_9FIRM
MIIVSKVIVVGSINKDLVFNTKRHPIPGETVIGDTHFQFNGGKGANQAVAAARLGASVTMVGAVGNDQYGLEIFEDLKRENINTDYISFKKNQTGLAAITIDEVGENSIVVIPGANGLLEPKDIPNDLISSKDTVLLQFEIPLPTVEHVAKIAKSAGATVILDPAPALTIPESIYQYIDIIKPNQGEAKEISGHDCINKAAEFLLHKGVKQVIITLGRDGAILFNENGQTEFANIKVETVDTTAAGDSFSGALAAALSRGEDIEKAIGFAIKVAAKTVTKMGAQSSLPRINEIF